jgi:outer membrane receptor protein involved in Fe transport
MKTKVVLAVFTLALWLVSAVHADQAPAPLREELLFQEIPDVFTAAKFKQPLSDAPSPTIVITEKDIKLSGAANIQELFRSLPGIDLYIASASSTYVTVRGHDNMPNNILTMIDGFPVYEDFFGTTLWEILPITLGDIKQIEIIKGPGSALYGANAFAGVINIITKRPEDFEEQNSLSATAGEQATRGLSFTTARSGTDWGNKLTLSYDGANDWADPSQQAKSFSKMNFTLSRSFADDRRLTLSSYLGGGSGSLLAAIPTALSINYTENAAYCHLSYEEPGLSVLGFLNSTQGHVSPFAGAAYYCATNTLDTEIRRTAKWENQTLVLGGEARYNKVNGEIIDSDHDQFLWDTYLQDEVWLRENLALTLGGRYDYHPLVKDHFSPRASLVFKPHPGQLVRLEAATAFRNPSYSESYARIPNPFTGGTLFYGNPTLESESLNNYELDLETALPGNAAGGLNLFYTDIGTIIDLVTTYSSLVPGLPLTITPVNRAGYTVAGGEMYCNYPFNKYLTGWANYSYQSLHYKNGGLKTDEPANKANLGLKYWQQRVNASLTVDYVGGITANGITGDPYTIFSAHLGYGLTERSEIALSAFNLLNYLHEERPGYEEVGRKVTLTYQINY